MATKVCIKRAYTDQSGSRLLEHGDTEAASLVAAAGARVDESEIEPYGDTAGFFVDEENYKEPEKKPAVSTVMPVVEAGGHTEKSGSVTVKRADPKPIKGGKKKGR